MGAHTPSLGGFYLCAGSVTEGGAAGGKLD